MNNNKEEIDFSPVKNLTDKELDELLRKAMKEQGYKRFVNYQGEVEELE